MNMVALLTALMVGSGPYHALGPNRGEPLIAWATQPQVDSEFALLEMPDEEGLQSTRFWGLDFAGDNDYGIIPAAAISPGTGSACVEFWLRPTSLTGNQRAISKDAGGNYRFIVQISGSGLSFYVRDASANAAIAGVASGLTIDTWAHIACVVDRVSDVVRIYLNGAPVGSTPSIASVGTLTDDGLAIDLGRRNVNEEFLSARLTQLRSWNVLRTPSEVAGDMLAPRYGTGYPGLVAEYAMQPGNGQSVADETGNGHTTQLGSTSGVDANDPTWTAARFSNLTSEGPK